MGLCIKGKFVVKYVSWNPVIIDGNSTGYVTNTVIEYPVGKYEIRLQEATVPEKIEIEVLENKCTSVLFQKKN